MIVVNLSDGSTKLINLEDPENVIQWDKLLQSNDPVITGLALKVGSVLHSLPLPKQRFKRVIPRAELVYHRNGSGHIVGQRITIYADDIEASILAYTTKKPAMIKYNLRRVGRPVYLPPTEYNRDK